MDRFEEPIAVSRQRRAAPDTSVSGPGPGGWKRRAPDLHP